MSNKVKISSLNNKLYSHSYRCTNSTSANFSYVQPLLCRMLMPSGSIKGSLKQFVRLSAMPKPTFGDLRVNNAAYFIPIETIMPEFMAMMSNTPYRSSASSATAFVPSSVIKTTNQELYKFLFGSVGSKAGFSTSVIFSVPVDSTPAVASLDENSESAPTPFNPVLLTFEEWYDRFYPQYEETGDCFIEFTNDDGEVERVSCYNENFINLCKKYQSKEYTLEQCVSLYDIFCGLPPVSTYGANSDITPFQNLADSFDYINVVRTSTASASSVIGYRLTDSGRALRKILLGLGYQPSADDVTTVSVLPLLAFYKAYYDRFIPYRMLPWETTIAFRLIQNHEQYPYNDPAKCVTPNLTSSATYDGIFSYFIVNELATCFTSKSEDFLSIHQYNIGENFRPVGYSSDFGYNSLPDGVSSQVLSPQVALPVEDGDGNQTKPGSVNAGLGVLRINGSPSEINALQLRALQKIYGALGRDSIIGNRLELWARSHLNSDVYNEIFRRSNCVGSNRFAISISDVDSLANTRAEDNTTGDVLGNYAGKGIGTGDLSFKCKADTYGFFIVLSWIEPITSFWQGTDAQLFATSRTLFPLKEYDAFGYEITKRSACWNDNNISVNADNSYKGLKSIGDSQGFGYVPRYSGFKYAKNIVNGDMSLRSLQGSMRPYYLDRTFVSRELEFQPLGNDGIPIGPIKIKDNKLPVASPVWRWVQRYPWLGNYNTMFYNSDALSSTSAVWDNDKWTAYKRTWAQDDNFFIHCVFDFTENSQLRPLSESYDTKVLDSDTSVEVQRQ